MVLIPTRTASRGRSSWFSRSTASFGAASGTIKATGAGLGHVQPPLERGAAVALERRQPRPALGDDRLGVEPVRRHVVAIVAAHDLEQGAVDFGVILEPVSSAVTEQLPFGHVGIGEPLRARYVGNHVAVKMVGEELAWMILHEGIFGAGLGQHEIVPTDLLRSEERRVGKEWHW